MLKRLGVAGVLAGFCCVILAGGVFAGGVIELADTSWEIDGKSTASLSKVGKLKEDGLFSLVFGASTFDWADPSGAMLSGGFSNDSKGTARLDPSAMALDGYLRAKITQIAAAEGVDVFVKSVVPTKVDVSVKPKGKKGEVTADAKVKIKAEVLLTIDGEDIQSKLNLSAKAKGANPAMLEGTEWTIPTTEKLAVKRLGTIRDMGTLDIFFTSATDFVAVGDGGVVFSGTWALDAKGDVLFQPLASEVEAYLADLIEDGTAGSDEPVTNVVLSLTSSEASAKLKPGVSMKLNYKASFEGSGDVLGERVFSTGTYRVKGTGCPAL